MHIEPIADWSASPAVSRRRPQPGAPVAAQIASARWQMPLQTSSMPSPAIRTCTQVGELTLCEFEVGKPFLVTERKLGHREGRDIIGVCTLLCGSAILTSNGDMTPAHVGDLILFEAGKSFELLLQSDSSCLIITLPASAIRPSACSVSPTLPANVSGSVGPGLLLAGMLRSLPEAVRNLDFASPSATAIVSGVENLLLSTAMQTQTGCEPAFARYGRVEQVKAYVLAHLRDPDLSVERIARGLHMSVSTIHRAFGNEPYSVMSWIWTMRLDGARRDLSDAMKLHRNITEVAFSWGFNDTAHFSRSFRSRFGHTPRQQRSRPALSLLAAEGGTAVQPSAPLLTR